MVVSTEVVLELIQRIKVSSFKNTGAQVIPELVTPRMSLVSKLTANFTATQHPGRQEHEGPERERKQETLRTAAYLLVCHCFIVPLFSESERVWIPCTEQQRIPLPKR